MLPALLYSLFPYYLINGKIFEKKKSLNANCVFWFPLQLLSETFLILRRNEPDVIKMYFGLRVRYVLFLSDFNETRIFLGRISKNNKLPISWKSVYREPSCSVQTDMTKLIVVIRNFANASKNIRSAHGCIYVLSLYLKTSLISLRNTNWFTPRHLFTARYELSTLSNSGLSFQGASNLFCVGHL